MIVPTPRPPPVRETARPASFERIGPHVAIGSLVGIGLYLLLFYIFRTPIEHARLALYATILISLPLLYDLVRKIVARELGADLLAGISIVTSVVLGEYLAGAIVVLMLSGGAALERLAVARASSVLRALAKRAPTIAHRKTGHKSRVTSHKSYTNAESQPQEAQPQSQTAQSQEVQMEDVGLEEVAVGDTLVVFPHEICPVDGVVVEGHGVMDESYLTGEPFEILKTPGSGVLSGAVNGHSAITIRATRPAVESRFAKIMGVMRETEQKRPRLRRLGDRLGAVYAPAAIAVAVAAWIASGEPVRFLAVLVIATPCPLLIAIPVAIIGAISLAAKRTIIIRNPAVMEQIESCRTIIFDKTGTLTYGTPTLTDQTVAPGVDGLRLLGLAGSLESYSKHPLATAIVTAARDAGAPLMEASEISERPGIGLVGNVQGHEVLITGRPALEKFDPAAAAALPAAEPGLECVVMVDGRYAGRYRFRDTPRMESRPFVGHLGRMHTLGRVLLVSGDRESEVAYLAQEVGITEVHAGKSPEEKVAIVVEETKRANTLFLGDGINDAPALLAATVGVAFGQKSDVTAEAAGAVIMEASLRRVDEFFHISRRMRRIALESAVGGIALSVAGMGVAAFGLLTPVAGAVIQELIDLAAVLNALRIALPPGRLSDF